MATVDFLSASVNKTSKAVAWGKEVFAYGSASGVALRDPTDPQDNGVQTMLYGHEDRVNAVAIASEGERDIALISGAADGTIRVWVPQVDVSTKFAWKQAAVIAVGSSVTCLALLTQNSSSVLLWAGSTDGRVTCWQISLDGTVTELQRIVIAPSSALCLSICVLPSGVRILAIGGLEAHVRLYAAPAEGQFTLACTLRGHADWVGAASFAVLEDGRALLATGAQDRSIRIWAIAPRASTDPDQEMDPLLRKIQDLMRRHELASFSVGEHVYSARLEALLAGHEDWVRSVCWAPRDPISGIQPLCLLSASVDKSAVIWRPDADAGVWLGRVRLGGVGGQNNFGFYGAVFGPDGRSMVAHGHNGALHLWRAQLNEDGQEQWFPHVISGGHFGPVVDAAWDPSAMYLVTVSADQTTRLFAEWAARENRVWYEVGRAQVHGHDMACIAFTGNHQFVTGAEEKVLRVFDAPQSCLDSLEKIMNSPLVEPARKVVALTAHTPALGLSNKAVMHGGASKGGEDDDDAGGDQDTLAVQTVVLTQPPFEEDLFESTLWAESEKLYGHGYELFCVASDHGGRTVASACKASQAEFATIWLWNTDTWAPVGELATSTLTVTQMAFSPDDEWLLSVSRDRSFALSRRTQSDAKPYKVAFVKPKAHARIIWSCAWAPGSRLFATASRDGQVCIWRPEAPEAPVASIKVATAATAVAFAPCVDEEGRMVLVVGTEKGSDSCFLVVRDDGKAVTIVETATAISGLWPLATINRLVWRKNRAEKEAAPIASRPRVQLGIVASDNSVRIATIDVARLINDRRV